MAKKRKVTPEQAKAFWGKHYGVGFMRAIGFKCERIGEDKFIVYKIKESITGVFLSKKKIGTYCKADFMKVAMKNGFKPESEMTDNHNHGFKFIYTKEKVNNPNTSGIEEHYTFEI